MRSTRLLAATALITLALGATALALFSNGDFEAGNYTGWTKSQFINPGLQLPQPFTGASIVRGAGGTDRSSIVSAASPLAGTDGLVAAVHYPRFGSSAALVNYFAPANPGGNANSIRQSSTIQNSDVDSDGVPHVRFAFLPVLEDGSHAPEQQSWFYIVVRNTTRQTTVWQRFTFANEAGVPWQSSGLYRYTGWTVVDVPGGTGVMEVGDTVELEVIASGCSLGGHRGHVYVDAIGSKIPGGSVVATAPTTTVPGASLTYNIHVDNDGLSALQSPVVTIAVPAQTTFASVTNGACSHSSGTVTCNLADLPANSSIDFDLTVTVGGAATGTITLGNYSVAGTGYPALLGPPRSTVVGAPVAVADAYTTNEDAPLTVAAPGVLGNDSDPTGDSLTAVIAAQPLHGAVTLNADGSFTYTPAANYHGPDSFRYRASDGTIQSTETNVLLTVASVNDGPVGTADSYSVGEDGTLNVAAAGVLGNDSDVDGDALTAALGTGPAHGLLTLNPDGSFSYQPTANYNGPDSFTYTATDGIATTAPITVSLTVSAVNDAPVAAADSFTTAEDTPLVVAAPGVLANDSDTEGSTLSAVVVSLPAHGSLTLNPDGSFTYSPAANYNGPDGFTYRASDGSLTSGVTTVSFTVTAVPDAPSGTSDGTGGTYTTNEDGSLSVSAPGVLGNDTDGDGDPLTAILATPPAHGTLTLNPDGSFVYTPGADYSGPDSFTYIVSDGTLTSPPVTVTLVVSPVNDPPVATPNSYTFTEDHTLTVPASSGLLANDSDVDSGSLTASVVTGPAHGTLTLNPDGSFTFVPDPGYNGTDTFTYSVSDGTTTSPPVTVTLTIADDNTLSPGAGRDTGGTRVTIGDNGGGGYGTPGTPVTVTIGGVPAIDPEILPDGTITFVTPPLPPGTPLDVVFSVNGGPPETIAGGYLPMPVPAAGSPTDTDGDGIPDEIELKYGLDPTNPADANEDPDNDGVPSGVEITQGRHPNAPYIRYFAEGLNNTRFNTVIAIANSSAATMEVQLTFFRQTAPFVRHNMTLPGRTRVLLDTATVAGLADAAFGVEIAGNEAVAADRTTVWNLGGQEGHSEHAVESSKTWYFAEGATTGRFSLFYLLTNPNGTPATATVTFLRQVGDPIVRTLVVPAFARQTIWVNTTDPGLASADLGGIVTADLPIVAERSMYLSTETELWKAGTGGTGVTSPSLHWFFGEGATGDFFDAWILLSNPGTTDATVDVRYAADSGADVTRSHVVPAGHRITIRVVDEDPSMRNTSFATIVTSTNGVPVVGERAMWWRANEGGWTAGHVGVGFTEGGRRWVTADGIAATDGSSDTYALVSNTTGRAGMLKVTALFGDGTAPIERLFAIGPYQRFTIRGRDRFPEVVGKGYSLVIESIGASPVDIVVDHSTYWNIDGRFWAAGTTSPGSRVK